MSETYKVTAKIHHGTETTTDHRNEVHAKDMPATRANIRESAPVGSTIEWTIERW
jgi:hypothetical protein